MAQEGQMTPELMQKALDLAGKDLEAAVAKLNAHPRHFSERGSGGGLQRIIKDSMAVDFARGTVVSIAAGDEAAARRVLGEHRA